MYNEITLLEATILYKENQLCDLNEALSFASLSNQYDLDKLSERFERLDAKYKMDGLLPLNDFSALSRKDKIKIGTYLGIKKIGGVMMKRIVTGAATGFIAGAVATELTRVYGHKAIDAITHDGKNMPKKAKFDSNDNIPNRVTDIVNGNIIPRLKGDAQNGTILAAGGAIIGAGSGLNELIRNNEKVETVEVRVKDRDIFVQKDKNNKIFTMLLLYKKKRNNKTIVKVFKV